MKAITFSRTFSAAHRLWNDASKCRNIHGHNYQVTVKIERGDLAPLNEQGFIVPFDEIKAIIDALDHVLILDMDDPMADGRLDGVKVVTIVGPPSTERLAEYLAGEIAAAIESGTVRVHLRETEGILAYAEADVSSF